MSYKVDSKTVILKPVAEDADIAVADGVQNFVVPSDMDGYILVEAHAHVFTVSSSGTPTVMIHNATDTQDMLSTAITIDVSEYDSITAATAPVVNTTYDNVAAADVIRIDVDVIGTGTKGLEVRLTFERS